MNISVAASFKDDAQNSSSAYPRVPNMLIIMINTRKTCKKVGSMLKARKDLEDMENLR